MKNGRDKPNQKIKDMTRSVLPSKARKGARDDKRNMHRQYRHSNKQLLNNINGVPVEHLEEIYEASEDDFTDASNELKNTLPYIISDRRNADKLKPFHRWAAANTKDLNNEVEKYYQIKSLIGSSVIKDHALG